MNPYRVLGVAPDAPHAEIRRAYLALARRHHPDQHTGGSAAARSAAETEMRRVNEAWALVGDRGARQRYDESRNGHGSGGTNDGWRSGRGPVIADPADIATHGWRPRADDTAWMDDFAAWRDETDDLVPPDPAPSTRKRLVTIAPVGVFALAVVTGSLGLVLSSRPLLAGAFVAVMISAGLFVLIGLWEMSRGRHR